MTNRTMGLIVFGSVFGLAAAAALGAWLALREPAGRAPGLDAQVNVRVGGGRDRDETEAERVEKLTRELAAHSFWRVKMTAADVDRIAGQIAAAKGTDVAFLDDGGKLAIERGLAAEPAYRFLRKNRIAPEPPAGLSERYVYFDLDSDFATRPTRELVLRHVKAALDVYDYRR